MGRAPCCSKVGLHRGPWTPREDTLLVKYIQAHGEGHWRSFPKKAGLLRCGKSCTLRWMNYLRPDIKRGNITPDEEDLIIRLHSLLGNRWSLIAGRLPGRTDNEIKNYWNTHLSKRLLSQGTDPNTHKKLPPDNPVVVLVPKKKRKKSNKRPNKSKKPTEQEKPKIHLPKPIRFTSSVQCTTKSSSQGGENGQVLVPWSEYINDDENRTRFLCYNDDHDLINNSDFECQSHHHHHHHHDHGLGAQGDSNDSLEKIYEEYLQLLKTNEDQVQLDSFAESLLI